jgi:beta-lactamase regulating signal transducer with metallopeptidase domain
MVVVMGKERMLTGSKSALSRAPSVVSALVLLRLLWVVGALFGLLNLIFALFASAIDY